MLTSCGAAIAGAARVACVGAGRRGARAVGPVTRSRLSSSGRLPASRGVVQRAGLTELTITGIGPFPYQLDGDYLGEAESLSIRYEPACLDLYVP